MALSFLAGVESLTEISFPIDVTVSAAGAALDLPRGGLLTLIVKRGVAPTA